MFSGALFFGDRNKGIKQYIYILRFGLNQNRKCGQISILKHTNGVKPKVSANTKNNENSVFIARHVIVFVVR